MYYMFNLEKYDNLNLGKLLIAFVKETEITLICGLFLLKMTEEKIKRLVV